MPQFLHIQVLQSGIRGNNQGYPHPVKSCNHRLGWGQGSHVLCFNTAVELHHSELKELEDEECGICAYTPKLSSTQ